jgi:hypothetical protein
MAAQKLARKKREEAQPRQRLSELFRADEAARARKKRASKSRIVQIKPIEEYHVPHAWRQHTLRIEPLFDQAMMESPGQIGFAQMAAAISRQSEPPVEEGAFTPVKPTRQHPDSTTGPAHMGEEVMSPQALVREQQMEMVRNPVRLTASAAAHPPMQKARLTRAQVLFERFRLWVRQMLAMLSRWRGPSLTPAGMLTLRQLQRLYALIGAGWAVDDMEMVRLKVAFGEAYYQVMEASRRKRTHRRKDEPGEYQAYIERFLAAEQF